MPFSLPNDASKAVTRDFGILIAITTTQEFGGLYYFTGKGITVAQVSRCALLRGFWQLEVTQYFELVVQMKHNNIIME